MQAPALSVGVELTCVRELPGALDAAVAAGFDFAALPLFHPRGRREGGGGGGGAPHHPPREEPPTRSDLTLDSARWTTSVVGALSPWLALDSSDPGIRRESERALRQELQWASHLGVPAVLAPPPAGAQPCAGSRGPLAAPNYAAHLCQVLEAAPALHVWLRVPLTARAEPPAEGGGDDDDGGGSDARPAAAAAARCALPLAERARDDPWEGWNALRQLSECHPRLSVALEITAALPSPAAIARWAGEPVKAAILPTSVFTAAVPSGPGGAAAGAPATPVLSVAHQRLVAFLAQYRVQFLLRGRPRCAGGYGPYLAYLQRLTARLGPSFAPTFALPGCTPASQYLAAAVSSPAACAGGSSSAGGGGGLLGGSDDSEEEEEEGGWEALSSYLDVLQAPLQPLADNLESQTYETFERDPVKYDQYQAAIAAALRARRGRTGGAPVVVWVVGAGRGPLVTRALAAGDATRVPVRVVAVEKNANAVITLRNLRAATPAWRERVTLVSSDMRHLTALAAGGGGGGGGAAAGAAAAFTAPCGTVVPPADVLVSELLGSFGDNELSPECLDGVMRFLRPPPPPGAPPGAPPAGVSIPSAYTSFLAPVTSHALWNGARAFGSATREETKWLETAYVVRMWRHHTLGQPLPVFTFSHGSGGSEDEGGGGSPPPPPDNRRYACLRWVMPAGDGAPSHLLHGFGGYFDATLFEPEAGGAGGAPPERAAAEAREQAVHISTAPHTHTPGMFSWFPLFFPLRTPVHVAPGAVVELHMWRCVSAAKVWYEWALASPLAGPVHNPAGRSYAIGL